MSDMSNNNKSVTFGGVVHFPALPKANDGPKSTESNKKAAEADSKSVSVKNRFNCGSLRNSLKMVGSNGSTLIAIRLVRSKLRKREDSLPTTTTTTPATPTAQTTTTTSVVPNNNNNVIQQSNNLNSHLHSNNIQQNNQLIHTTQQQQQSDATDALAPPFLWVYHSNGTSTTASSQYTLYNNDQDTLVHNLQCEEPRECKGFRKNLRGKWRRLVKKKPQQEVYTIPAELRDQLKQIYVY